MSKIYLTRFDDLDLAKKEHRRMAVYTLHEYFGAVMWEVGRTELGFGEQWKTRNVRDQWNEIRTRLDVIGGIDVPDEYSQIGDRVYDARSNVTHNKQYDPNESNITSLREIAPRWEDWLVQTAESFHKSRRPVSPYEGITDLILRNVEIIKRRPSPTKNPVALDEARHMKIEAERIADRVNTVEHNHQNLEKLTRLLMEVITLRKDMHTLSRDPSDYIDPPDPDEPLFYERIDDWEGSNDSF